jgi:tetratricopeptide (TPR) repeat protein
VLEQVRDRQKNRGQIDDKDHVDTATMLGGCYLQLGRGEEAINAFKPLFEHFLSAKGPKDDQTLLFQGGLVEAYFVAGKKEDAVKTLDALVAASREVNADEPLKVAETLKRAAMELTKNGFGEAAEKHLRESLAIFESKEAPKWDKLAVSVHLARALAAQTKYDEAEKLLLEAHDLATKFRAELPPEHKFLISLCADSLQDLYKQKGDSENAAKWKSVFTEEIELTKPK